MSPRDNHGQDHTSLWISARRGARGGVGAEVPATGLGELHAQWPGGCVQRGSRNPFPGTGPPGRREPSREGGREATVSPGRQTVPVTGTNAWSGSKWARLGKTGLFRRGYSTVGESRYVPSNVTPVLRFGGCRLQGARGHRASTVSLGSSGPARQPLSLSLRPSGSVRMPCPREWVGGGCLALQEGRQARARLGPGWVRVGARPNRRANQRDTWVAQSLKHQTLAQVVMSQKGQLGTVDSKGEGMLLDWRAQCNPSDPVFPQQAGD